MKKKKEGLGLAWPGLAWPKRTPTIYMDSSQNTDKNILDNFNLLVTYFPDFPLWENRIAYFE